MRKCSIIACLSVFLAFFCSLSYSQNIKLADRYFEEFSYAKSAEFYKALYFSGKEDSKYILERLVDSYYNNGNTEDAEIWFERLIDDYNVSDDYLFKYIQILRSNKKYKKSDSILLLSESLKRKLNSNDKRTDYMLEVLKDERKKVNINNLYINSEFSDYGGYIINGKVYYSSSALVRGKQQQIYNRNNQPFLNIYKAKMSIEPLKWNEKDSILVLHDAKILEPPVTTKFHEGKPIFSNDGKTMYFTRNNFNGKRIGKDINRVVNLKIYRAKLVNGIWSKITELPFNSDDYSVGHPALSLDEKTLYFSSDMPGGFGLTDIYKVKIYADDNFGIPQNLGETINTSGRETFPFVGNNSLYFSSDGHLGFGLLDIYEVKMNSEGDFIDIKNLGPPFNSNKDDFAFYINSECKFGFFSSNRLKGKGDDDIYSFYFQENECLNNILGNIKNKRNGLFLSRVNVKLINEKGKVVKETKSDSLGEFSFYKVDCDKNYFLKASRENFESIKKDVKFNKNEIIDFHIDLELNPLIVNNEIVLNPIYFDYNSYEIQSETEYELEKVVQVMQDNPKMIIKIESHTDSRGDDVFNKVLSNKRAKSTRDYLISRGINKKRIASAIGYGEERLLNHCNNENLKKCSEKEHSLNRRSNFYILRR
ncbi:conserved exported hypothetical protein [Tenacibaculum sediminilitoris]|uniref:OmpA family protein n=1 Tax=Tenacibaculum sediminilitoris TaxID=1820334 RepID=UPI0038952238